jgi:uncharacterized spore protein YtfJ
MFDRKHTAPDSSMIESVTTIPEKISQIAGARGVFGEPVQKDDTLVIPCAELAVGMGMGVGSGSEDNESGGGGGSGGGTRGRPVAAIVITPHRVYVEPILDVTKVVLAALTTAAFMAAWISRLNRAMHSAKGDSGPSFGDAQRAIRDA